MAETSFPGAVDGASTRPSHPRGRPIDAAVNEGFSLISQNSQFLDIAGSPIILTQESGYYLGSCYVL